MSRFSNRLAKESDEVQRIQFAASIPRRVLFFSSSLFLFFFFPCRSSLFAKLLPNAIRLFYSSRLPAAQSRRYPPRFTGWIIQCINIYRRPFPGTSFRHLYINYFARPRNELEIRPNELSAIIRDFGGVSSGATGKRKGEEKERDSQQC